MRAAHLIMQTTTPVLGTPVPNWRPPSHPSGRVLAGRLARLEALDRARHAAGLFEAQSRDTTGDSWTYLPYGPFASLADYTAWMQATCSGTDPLFYAFVDPANDAPLGIGSFMRIAPAAGSIEIGHLHFSPQLQRTPMATEALFLMMREAFGLGYRRLEWKCNALNTASRRAALRLGFQFEGIFRQAAVVKGRNRDTAWFSVIDGEWPALQAAFAQWLAPENFDAEGRQRQRLSALTAAALGRETADAA